MNGCRAVEKQCRAVEFIFQKYFCTTMRLSFQEKHIYSKTLCFFSFFESFTSTNYFYTSHVGRV